jgi:phosphoglycolate phosphatase-like HAD superfamily hydrolase
LEPRRIRAVLFDLDGTLVHTRIDFPRMKEGVLAELRAEGFDPEPFRPLDALAIIERVATMLPDPSGFRHRAELALRREELAVCDDAVEAEGAVETLNWLHGQGVAVGIVTRNCREAVARALERVPLPYQVLLTRADTPRVKPDPLHLHLALERLGVAADAALMVGDHVMDVRAGHAAGMAALGVLLPERSPDYFLEAQPDGVIRKLPELRAWISRS